MIEIEITDNNNVDYEKDGSGYECDWIATAVRIDPAEALKALEEQEPEVLGRWLSGVIDRSPAKVAIDYTDDWKVKLLNIKGSNWIKVSEQEPPKDKKIVGRTRGGVICSMKHRYGVLGEPQQDVLDWRCDCCGRFGGMFEWMPVPK